MKNILILAAGGGFDILTIQMIKNKMLRKLGNICIDTAGWLNPKFNHFFRYNKYVKEKAINFGFHDVRRFRQKDVTYSPDDLVDYFFAVKNLEEKSMVDNELLHMGYKICDFSTQYGLQEICQYVMGYDELVVCDIGGDILYHGMENNEVRTPHIDGFSIALLDKVRGQMPASCVVVCPGVDLELSSEHIEACFRELECKNGITNSTLLDYKDIKFLEEIFKKFKNKAYGGNTIRRIFDQWDEVTGLDKLGNKLISNYKRWFLRVVEINADAICEYSPFSMCNSMQDVDQILKNYGWNSCAL